MQAALHEHAGAANVVLPERIAAVEDDECQVRVSSGRHPVAVVDPAQVAEHLMAGERGRFARYSLHHVAVAAQHIDVVVEYCGRLPAGSLWVSAMGVYEAVVFRRVTQFHET
jgi:hypothetical protein